MSTTTAGPKGPRHGNTYIAGGAIVNATFVKRGADQNTIVQATAASTNIGIACDDQDTAGRPVLVADAPGEKVLVRAGAAFALDALLTSDANGKAVTATTGQVASAKAQEAATAVDQLVSAINIAPVRVVAP